MDPLTGVLARLELSGDCWRWTATCDSNGYGRYTLNGRTYVAHRLVYELLVGRLARRLTLDHLCRVRSCCNPDHLEPVTHAENMRRSAPARKTRCANGHEYTPQNTYRRPSGQRDCRMCIRDRAAGYRERRMAVAA